MSVQILPRAALDIDEIAEYLGLSSPDIAERFHLRLSATFSSIEAMPLLGSPVEVRAAAFRDARFWPIQKFRRHYVIYRPVDDGIQVLRVLRGARDIRAMLESD